MSELWAITEHGLAAAVAQLDTGAELQAPAPVAGRIYVRGVLTREPSPFSRLLGSSTYEGLAAEVRAQVAGGARALVLDIDSPGGQVAGAHDIAALVAGLGIPTVAEVRGSACSAAYWLASACDSILATPDAMLGSVGVLMPAPPAREMEGVAVASLSPRKGLRDDPQWQELADDAAALMLADIARWRGLGSAADVSAAYGGGAVVSGGRAVALGLADGYLTAVNEEGPMPKSSPAPAAARAEAPPARTPEEYEAIIAELMATIAELKEKLADKEEPAEEEEMPAEAQAIATAHGGTPQALTSLAARVAELEAATRASAEAARVSERERVLSVAVAEGRIAPGERDVAEALYDTRPELYATHYGSRPAGAAVPLGRVSHSVPVAESPSTRAHAEVLAYCEAHGLDPRTQYHVAAVKVGASKGV